MSSPSLITYSSKSSIGIFTFNFVKSPLAFNSTSVSEHFIFKSEPNVFNSNNTSTNFFDEIV